MTNSSKVVRIGTRCGDIATRYVGELSLEFLQKCVGGYIEPAAPVELREKGIEVLVNEEGLLKGLDVNHNFYPFFFVGQAVAVGVDGEDFVGLTNEQTNYVLNWFENLKMYRGENGL